jgi:hypothetical protein
MARQTQNWNKVKGKIFDRGFKSIAACARELDCSTDALRLTARGKCPGVRSKLEELLK